MSTSLTNESVSSVNYGTQFAVPVQAPISPPQKPQAPSMPEVAPPPDIPVSAAARRESAASLGSFSRHPWGLHR